MAKIFPGYRRSLALAVFLAITSTSVFAAESNYRLGIVISVDQFRADYFMRFGSEFKGGYKTLLEKGAYFPLADHGLLQNMTGPGHAAIMTGSYPYRNHIPINYWIDRDTGKENYCVQDDSVKIVGSAGIVPDAKIGISPRNLNADTVGDELKNVDRASRTVSISIKDRAAVLMGGRRTDHTLWFDNEHCQWVTSTFYEKALPDFAQKQNAVLKSEQHHKYSWGPFKDIEHCSKESIPTPWSIERTFDLALDAIDEMKLGQGKDTDLLTLSLSAHDYLGHRFGPNSPYLKQMTLAEDELLGTFLNRVAKKLPGGLNDVFVVLTGDHGMPPTQLPSDRVDSENIKLNRLTQAIEDSLTQEYGKLKNGKWIMGVAEFQVYLNHDALKDKKVTVQQAFQIVRERLLKEPYLDDVWSRDDILNQRKSPPGELGQIADRTVSVRSGDIIPILKPFFYSDDYPFSHMTHYSYDRYVPLVFMGKSFKAGTYRQIVRVIDLAPTLSSVLHVLPPNQSEGRVLTEILR